MGANLKTLCFNAGSINLNYLQFIHISDLITTVITLLGSISMIKPIANLDIMLRDMLATSGIFMLLLFTDKGCTVKC